MEIDKDLLMWGLGLIGAAVIALVKQHAAKLEEIDRDINELALRLSDNYVKKDDLKETFAPVFRKLDVLESKIDRALYDHNHGMGEK